MSQVTTMSLSSNMLIPLFLAMPTYDGSSKTSVLSWTNQVENLKNMASWSDTEILTLLPFRLTGRAKLWFEEQCFATFADFKAKFVLEFKPHISRLCGWESVNSIKQGQSESVGEYVLRFDEVKTNYILELRLLHEQQGEGPFKVPDVIVWMIRDAFINGLLESLRLLARSVKPKNFEEAKEFVLQCADNPKAKEKSKNSVNDIPVTKILKERFNKDEDNDVLMEDAEVEDMIAGFEKLKDAGIVIAKRTKKEIASLYAHSVAPRNILLGDVMSRAYTVNEGDTLTMIAQQFRKKRQGSHYWKLKKLRKWFWQQ